VVMQLLWMFCTYVRMLVQWIAKRPRLRRIRIVLACVGCAKYNSFGIDEHAACDGVIDHMLLYYLDHFRRYTVTSEVQHCF
jgi:hypothetical protein